MLLVQSAQSVLHSRAQQFLCHSTRVVPASRTVYVDYMVPMWITVSLILHVRWPGSADAHATNPCVTQVSTEGYWGNMVPLFATIVMLFIHRNLYFSADAKYNLCQEHGIT